MDEFDKKKIEEMYLNPSAMRENEPKKWLIFIIILAFLLGGSWFFMNKRQQDREGQLINLNDGKIRQYSNTNDGKVSPISGLACENWNRRPIAVMQPSDPDARPAAGFSQADMVIEMPVITAGITRLMGIYICDLPEEVGSMRSARHDFIHLAKGLDAIFVSWGRSEAHSEVDTIGLAEGILNRREIDNINCNSDAGVSFNECSDPQSVCFRKEEIPSGLHNAYGRPQGMMKCAQELGYRLENNFSGYPHREEVPLEERPPKGNLRIGFAGAYAVNYEYDQKSNSYQRIWGGEADIDRNNGRRIAPKNVVVMIAQSEQIEGQYNNVQLGDPWYDEIESGQAFYYINGQEIKGSWKKSRSSISSKLIFLDDKGAEIQFVPGQIWVEILEPGQTLKWRTDSLESDNTAN
jgi:hypothetical protein